MNTKGGKILTYRKGVDGAADVKIRTVRAMKAEAREAAWAEGCHYSPSQTGKQRQLKDFLSSWFSLKAIPAARLAQFFISHLISQRLLPKLGKPTLHWPQLDTPAV